MTIICIMSGIIFTITMLLIVIIWLKKPLLTPTYTRKIQTDGEIEAHYVLNGGYIKVYRKEFSALSSFKKYICYYPEQQTNENQKWPVVIFANGTGVPVSKYEKQLERLATWGFITIGTQEHHAWNGFSSEMCLRLLIHLNENQTVDAWDSNPFYQAIDLMNIGLVGHSQGGVGVMNSATVQNHCQLIKTIVALSPTNMELAEQLMWQYDPSQLQATTLLLAGTGKSEETFIVSDEQLADIYRRIPASVLKVKLRRSLAEHHELLYLADGYVTAWLMWQLQADETAKKAFVGQHAEILTNRHYQSVCKNC